jgi:uncharacterized protein (PEP-CTERM system associated)
VAERAPRRARRGAPRGLLAGAALLAGVAAASDSRAQTGFVGAAGAFDGPSDAFGGGSRPLSPYGPVLQPGQTSQPNFWQSSMLPEFVDPGTPQAGQQNPPWAFRGSVQGRLGYTDNVAFSSSNQQASAFGAVVPVLTGVADNALVTGALSYRPRFQYYFSAPSQNNIDQLFNGRATITLVPDLLYLDLSGVADAQSVFGGFFSAPGGLNESDDSKQNTIQNTSFRVSPYLVHRFGTFANARVGYVYRYVEQSGDDAFLQGQTTPFFRATSFNSNEFYGVLSSGERFGRFGWRLLASSTDFAGTGTYSGAYNRVYTGQLRYAVTNELAVIVDGGWQDAFYNTTPNFSVNDPIWSVGFRYQPDQDSFLTVRYGEYFGRSSWLASGVAAVGVRTRLFGSYSQLVSNSALTLGDTLSTMRVDQYGNLVDSSSGVPAAVAYAAPLQNVQSGLFETQRGALAVSQSWPRDNISLGLSYQQQNPIANAPGTQAYQQTTTSISAGWTHRLEPTMTLTTVARYGISESDSTGIVNSGPAPNYSFTAALNRLLSPSVVASLRYDFISRDSTGTNGTSTRNQVILALTQTF